MAIKNNYEIYKPFKVKDPNYASGGNAKVLLVEDEGGKEYALKSLRINESRDVKKVEKIYT
ncbi:hypothetical protein [Paenibacillus gorillae]|uniref:hypothetical protein n=1 Tax=Paenibacillus gorillae TaxID=1243662 RepID=UPI0004AD10CC|nr:hypothetical protein [Paenibacillus gorillae]